MNTIDNFNPLNMRFVGKLLASGCSNFNVRSQTSVETRIECLDSSHVIVIEKSGNAEHVSVDFDLSDGEYHFNWTVRDFELDQPSLEMIYNNYELKNGESFGARFWSIGRKSDGCFLKLYDDNGEITMSVSLHRSEAMKYIRTIGKIYHVVAE